MKKEPNRATAHPRSPSDWNLWELGARDDNETAIPVKALYSDAVAVIMKSENWLKEGRCVFHDGKIKNTACQ